MLNNSNKLILKPLFEGIKNCSEFYEKEINSIINNYLYECNYKSKIGSYIMKPFKYPKENELFSEQLISPIRIPGETIGGIWLNENNQKILKININNEIFQIDNNMILRKQLIELLNDKFKGKKLIFNE